MALQLWGQVFAIEKNEQTKRLCCWADSNKAFLWSLNAHKGSWELLISDVQNAGAGGALKNPCPVSANQQNKDDGGPCSKKDANEAKIRQLITKRRDVLIDINHISYLAQRRNAAKLLK